MTRTRLLQEFSTPEGRNITFDYHGSTGLLKSRSDSGRGQSVTYQYDENGRLISAVSPTGEPIKLNFDLSLKGASVEVVHGQRSPVVYFIKPGWSVSRKVGLAEEVVSMQPDRSVIVLTPFGHLTQFCKRITPILVHLNHKIHFRLDIFVLAWERFLNKRLQKNTLVLD